MSKNFTIHELCKSATAEIEKIDNKPNVQQLRNLDILIDEVLQPARDEYGKPMRINSGFRSAMLNKAVGGAKGSYHLNGQAADIHADNEEEADELCRILQKQRLVDLVINEKRGKKRWVHVQWSYAPRHKFFKDWR